MKRLFLISAIVLSTFVACSYKKNTVPPEKAAKEYMTGLGFKTQGEPQCAGIDSDRDGYVSCSVAVVEADGKTRVQSLECAGITNPDLGCDNQTDKYAVGCKERLPKVLTKSGD